MFPLLHSASSRKRMGQVENRAFPPGDRVDQRRSDHRDGHLRRTRCHKASLAGYHGRIKDMFSKELHAGDPVVFTATKRGGHPERHAREIRPEPHGEGYVYSIDKFWTVTGKRGRQVALMTRRGKVHLVDSDHPGLHRASWWQRLIYRNRFPKLQPSGAPIGQLA